MKNLNDFGLKIRKYKCFGDKEQGFDKIKNINVIAGRNNSGKSSLLELIDYAINSQKEFSRSLWHGKTPPEIIAQSPLIKEELIQIFQEQHSGGDIPGNNHWNYATKNLISLEYTWILNGQHDKRFTESEANDAIYKQCSDLSYPERYIPKLANVMTNPLKGRIYRRIFAERNITPENDTSADLEAMGHGEGITNIIQLFLNKANYDSQLVETTFLSELNTVFKADAKFTHINCQQLENGKWEIYLEEKHKGRIPLSESGSGLQTIILVLVHIHLVPVAEKRELKDYVFGFEELENNLHPALLRNLLSYIYDISLKHGCLFFLTTHSNVEIDYFSKKENAQIVHVSHDNKEAYCSTVKTYFDKRNILDELDFRASDILQSNGIIWVEGPSDKTYLNKWIDLWSEGGLKEGIDYICIPYGGNLKSHLSSVDPDLVEEAISILRVNRNACILMDSDKKNEDDGINDTTQRLVSEFENIDGLAWVTMGREIENYIPVEAIASWMGIEEDVQQIDQYENIKDYLNNIKEGKGTNYINNKPKRAKEIIQYMTKDNIAGVLDLAEKLGSVCNMIKKWNNIEV